MTFCKVVIFNFYAFHLCSHVQVLFVLGCGGLLEWAINIFNPDTLANLAS